MAAEHPEILAATALIFFASTAQFQNRAKLARVDDLANRLEFGTVARLVRNRQLHIALFADCDNLIRLGRRAAKGLFHVDVNAALGCRDRHISVFIEPSRADSHDLGLGLIEHLPEVGKSLWRLHALGGLGSPFFVRVSYCDNFTAVLELGPNEIVAVSIIPAARITDDSDAIFRHLIHTGSKLDNTSSAAQRRVMLRKTQPPEIWRARSVVISG